MDIGGLNNRVVFVLLVWRARRPLKVRCNISVEREWNFVLVRVQVHLALDVPGRMSTSASARGVSVSVFINLEDNFM